MFNFSNRNGMHTVRRPAGTVVAATVPTGNFVMHIYNGCQKLKMRYGKNLI